MFTKGDCHGSSHRLTVTKWIFWTKQLVTKDVLSELSAETIDRKAKASVIFNRVRDHPSPSSYIATVMHQLQKYIEASRSEAMVSPYPPGSGGKVFL